MSLSIEEVEAIAELARLELSDEEKQRFAVQLSAILDYVRELEKIDTGAIPPTASVLPLQTVTRPDVPIESIPADVLLRNTPHHEGAQFKVKAVLDE